MHLPLHFQEKGREFGLENYRLKTTLLVCSFVRWLSSCFLLFKRHRGKEAGNRLSEEIKGEAEEEEEGVLQVLATRKEWVWAKAKWGQSPLLTLLISQVILHSCTSCHILVVGSRGSSRSGALFSLVTCLGFVGSFVDQGLPLRCTWDFS